MGTLQSHRSAETDLGSQKHRHVQAAAEIASTTLYHQSFKAMHHFGQQFSHEDDFDHNRCQRRVAFRVNVLFKKRAILTGQEAKP